jgi:hypothetical protein
MIIKFQIKKILECIFITARYMNFGGQIAPAATHVATGSETKARYASSSGSNRKSQSALESSVRAHKTWLRKTG